MNDVQLTTVNDIRQQTTISNNISPESLFPFITLSEDRLVYPILGEALTTELKNQITGSTLTDLNTVLLRNYIAPLAAWGAFYDFLPFNASKSSEAGEVEQAADNSTSASMEKIVFKRDNIRDFINHYSSKLKDYLEKNKASYPLYRSSCCTTSNNFGGIYLGRRG